MRRIKTVDAVQILYKYKTPNPGASLQARFKKKSLTRALTTPSLET